MRYPSIVSLLFLAPGIVAPAQVSIGVSLPGLSIGINQPVYPDLVPVPGYPVYYAPGSATNYFFYDGLYWVYQDNDWYSSEWYNGPWGRSSPDEVPLYVLRVPVRYYRRPPPYFRDWDRNAPPRWGDHWGHGWEQQRPGWDRWDRHAGPSRAPLPTYQRQYSGTRYPGADQQPALHARSYHYQPKEAVTRERYQQQRAGPGSGPGQPGGPRSPEPRQGPGSGPGQPGSPRSPEPRQGPGSGPGQRGGPQPQEPRPGPAQHPQPGPPSRSGNPMPPAAPHQPEGPRAGSPGPAPVPHQQPGPQGAPRPQPAPRPSGPNPPGAQRPQPPPLQPAQPHEAPRGNPNQGQGQQHPGPGPKPPIKHEGPA